MAAKNSLNDSINEQAVKLNELGDVASGADVHAETLARRVSFNQLFVYLHTSKVTTTEHFFSS